MSKFSAFQSVRVTKTGAFKNQVGTFVGDNPDVPGEVLVKLEKDAKNDALAKQVVKSLNPDTDLEGL